MKKILGIIVLGLLLSGCETTADSNTRSIVNDMKKDCKKMVVKKSYCKGWK